MIWGHRGFTLGEVLASLIALGIIALTVQSLMLVANNFLSQQSSHLSSIEERTYLNKFVCHKFQRPVFVEQNPRRSFTYNVSGGTGTYTKSLSDHKEKATLSVPLLGHSDPASPPDSLAASHPAVGDFLADTDNLSYADNQDDDAKVLRAHINDEATNFINIDGGGSHLHHSQFYDIYADNHTLPTFVVPSEGDSKLGEISDGFIYVSRCIKNEKNSTEPGSFIEIEGKEPKNSIIDQTDGVPMSSEAVLAVSLYVLEQKMRPFYFPEEVSRNQVKCCHIDSTIDSTNCKSLEEYTPIIYVIRMSSEGGSIEGEILNGTGTGLASLKGYVQNELLDLANHPACKHTTDGIVDLGGKSSTGEKCLEDIVKNRYFAQLGKGFAHPVKFESISELPLVKRDRVNAWAYGFIAPSFDDSGQQDMYKEFKLLSVENKCHLSMPVGLCGKAKPGQNLTLDAHKVNEKSVADYFITQVSHCPFHYITVSNSGGTIPLGMTR